MIIAKEKYTDTEHIANELKEKGVLLLPKFLSEEKTRHLLEEFEVILNAEENSFLKKLPMEGGRGASIHRAKIDDQMLPHTSSCFSDDFMNKVAAHYYGEKTYDLNDTIYVANDMIGTKHIAQDLHFDVVPTLKFFIYLTDTTAENGAFSCIPGSQKITMDIRKKYGRKISYRNRQLTRDIPLTEAEAIPVEAAGGSLIIFTTEAFHKAGIVSKGDRKIMRGHTHLKKNFVEKFLDKIFQT